MKHWFFYIRIPAEAVQDTPFFTPWLGADTITRLVGKSLSEADSNGFNGLNAQETDDGYVLCGLYAWTSSEDTAKLFKESRNPKYFFSKKMTIPVDTYDWEALRAQYKDREIVRTSYSDDSNHNFHIPMTRFESDILFEDGNQGITLQTIVERMMIERTIKRKVDSDFRVVLDIFDQTLSEALDLLSWTELVSEYGFADAEICKLGLSERDPEYLVDEYYQLSSFSMGFSGGEVADYQLEPVNVYIYMLGDLLK